MPSYTVPAAATGRFVTEGTDHPRAIVFSFHGYGQNAEENLADLAKIPRFHEYLVVAIQGLHWFYRSRTDEVVANWMTRNHREEAIANNLAYVRTVVDQVRETHHRAPYFFAGFSQGAAMAWRAASSISGAAGIVVLGGDLPPEITDVSSLPPILLGRGSRDEWYSASKLHHDLERLAEANVEVCEFDGGHEWGDPFCQRAAAFLERHAG